MSDFNKRDINKIESNLKGELGRDIINNPGIILENKDELSSLSALDSIRRANKNALLKAETIDNQVNTFVDEKSVSNSNIAKAEVGTKENVNINAPKANINAVKKPVFSRKPAELNKPVIDKLNQESTKNQNESDLEDFQKQLNSPVAKNDSIFATPNDTVHIKEESTIVKENKLSKKEEKKLKKAQAKEERKLKKSLDDKNNDISQTAVAPIAAVLPEAEPNVKNKKNKKDKGKKAEPEINAGLEQKPNREEPSKKEKLKKDKKTSKNNKSEEIGFIEKEKKKYSKLNKNQKNQKVISLIIVAVLLVAVLVFAGFQVERFIYRHRKSLSPILTVSSSAVLQEDDKGNNYFLVGKDKYYRIDDSDSSDLLTKDGHLKYYVNNEICFSPSKHTYGGCYLYGNNANDITFVYATSFSSKMNDWYVKDQYKFPSSREYIESMLIIKEENCHSDCGSLGRVNLSEGSIFSNDDMAIQFLFSTENTQNLLNSVTQYIDLENGAKYNILIKFTGYNVLQYVGTFTADTEKYKNTTTDPNYYTNEDGAFYMVPTTNNTTTGASSVTKPGTTAAQSTTSSAQTTLPSTVTSIPSTVLSTSVPSTTVR